MATVKRKASGKIVLKNGKVSCGCCEQAGCCMYPAQALVDGLYINDDLPDTIILKLTNQLQPGPEYCPREVLSRSYDGYLYGYGNPLDTTPGNKAARISLFFSEEQQGWFFSYLQVEYKEPGAGAENRVYIGSWEDTCLLQDMSGELIIEDEFAVSYTVQDFPWSGPFTVDRVSLCRWETTVSGTLYFGNPDNPPATGTWNAVIELLDYQFEVVLLWTNNNQSDFNYPNQLWRYSKLGAPTEPNSSPSGSYSGGEFGSISVS